MINPAWAQAAHPGSPPALVSFAPLVLIFVVFYFLLIRPQQQKAKEQRTMLANLKRNDEVITAGGLYGKIVALNDRVATLEIAPNVRVRVDRQQIASLAKSQPEEDKEKDKPK
ncbi:MAG TPA: preprotein translocase subunit YajC [Candidatus Acidoferrales bacterium]|nr:preprotein translocase subunit YajC [Candidatus Acidoferrales bacterium]